MADYSVVETCVEEAKLLKTIWDGVALVRTPRITTLRRFYHVTLDDHGVSRREPLESLIGRSFT